MISMVPYNSDVFSLKQGYSNHIRENKRKSWKKGLTSKYGYVYIYFFYLPLFTTINKIGSALLNVVASAFHQVLCNAINH